jgi:chromosome segregation ATPase
MLQAIQKSMLSIKKAQDRAEKLDKAEAEVRELKLKFSTAQDQADNFKKEAREMAKQAKSSEYFLSEERKKTADLMAELTAVKAKHAEEMAEEKKRATDLTAKHAEELAEEAKKARKLGMKEAAEDILNNQIPELQEDFLALGWKAALRACNVAADSPLFKEIPHSSDLPDEEEPLPETETNGADLNVEDYEVDVVGGDPAAEEGRAQDDQVEIV